MDTRLSTLGAGALLALAIGGVGCGYGEGSDTNQHQPPAATKPGAGQTGTGALPPNSNAGAAPAATPAGAPETAGDAAIRQAIERRLADAKITGVTVQVRGGRAFLSGLVPSAQYDAAVRAAEQARPTPDNGVDASALRKG
jgi:hypothetical protein